MPLLQRGTAWLAEKLQTAAGTDATYSRGNALSVSVTGTLAVAVHEVIDDAEGFMTKIRSYDWTFTAAELLLGGSQIEPRPGDRITVGNAVYEVMPLGSQPCWQPLDALGTLVTVHAKQVAT